MPDIGPMELAIVAIVALLVLGPKRLPAAGRSLGQGLREFRDGIRRRDEAVEVLEVRVDAPAGDRDASRASR